MEGNAFSLKDAIDIIKYRKAAYLLPFLFILIISVCVALVLPPVYESKATLLIEKGDPGAICHVIHHHLCRRTDAEYPCPDSDLNASSRTY